MIEEVVPVRNKGGRPRKYPYVPPPPPKDPLKEFLRGFLSGGAISRTNVYREVENKGLEWERVKETFYKMNGREYVQRGEYFWRLMPE